MSRSHSNTPASGRQAKETHRFHFRGCWLPPRVFGHVIQRRITAREMALLAMVDALTEPAGRGCFASDSYLGAQLGIGVRNVRRATAKLISLGLLKKSGSTSSRKLRVSWSDNTDSDELRTLGVLSAQDAGRPTEVIHLKKKKYTVVRAEPGTTVGGNPEMNGIFPALQDVLLVPAPDDFGCADRLHEASVKFGILSRRYNRLKSATHICRLRRQIGTPRLETVFGWFLANYRRDRYVPDARCGKSFAAKFEKIEDARARDLRDNPDVTVSIPALQISKWCREAFSDYPPDLEKAVQLSIDSITPFCKKLWKASDDDAGGFWCSLKRDGFASPEDLILQWFRDRHWVKKNMVPRHVLSLDNPDFVEMGRAAAHRWCGDRRLWDELVKELGHESGKEERQQRPAGPDKNAARPGRTRAGRRPVG